MSVKVPAQTGTSEKREKPLNYHMTERNGHYSVGTTEDEVGFYPAKEEEGTADAWVAPRDYVDNYAEVQASGHTDEAIREAIRSWVRDNEK